MNSVKWIEHCKCTFGEPIQCRQIRCFFLLLYKRSTIYAPISRYLNIAVRRKWFRHTNVHYLHVEIVCSIFAFLQHYLIAAYKNVLEISRILSIAIDKNNKNSSFISLFCVWKNMSNLKWSHRLICFSAKYALFLSIKQNISNVPHIQCILYTVQPILPK